MLIWPSELPQRVAAADFARTLAGGRRRAASDSGLTRGRRRFSAVAIPVAASLPRLTMQEFARFERFYWEEARHGSLPFLIPDQDRDGQPLLTAGGEPLLTADGVPLLVQARWLCQFGDGDPEERVLARGLYRSVSFSLLVMP